MRILLHACCAPCLIQCLESLGEADISADLLWYNPNIHPYTEYRSRRDNLYTFAEERELNLIKEDVYGLRQFVKSCENGTESNRCLFCYRLRLERTASLAREQGYDAFSTTLLISPFQNHELIMNTGYKLSERYRVKFHYQDFRPQFRKSLMQARSAGYYMQKYCGCIYSEEERYLGQ